LLHEQKGAEVKRYRIRKYSPIWWAGKVLKWTGQLALLAVVEWGIIIAMLAMYSQQRGLPMPWEGLI
jgi:hypothetical protein